MPNAQSQTAEYNFPEIIRGSTWMMSLMFPVGFDLTGHSARVQVKSTKKSVLLANIENGTGITINIGSRVVSWQIDTAAWPLGDSTYALRLTNPAGNKSFPLKGTMKLVEVLL